MKQIIVVLGVVFLFAISSPFLGAHAQIKGEQDWTSEARKIWNRERSPGDMERWTKRLEWSRTQGKKQTLALCLNVVGNLYYLDGNLTDSLKFLKESIQISREHGTEGLTMSSLLWLASAQRDLGLYEEAVKSARGSLTLAKKLDSKQTTGSSLLVMGSALTYMGQAREAMPNLERGLSLARTLKNKSMEKSALSEMGRLYLFQGDHQRAKAFFSESLRISEELQDKVWIITCLNGLWDISVAQKDYNAALKYCIRSAALSEELSNKATMSSAYRRMGRIYGLMNDGKKAIHYFDKAYTLAKAAGSKTQLALIFKGKGATYDRMKNWDQAIKEIDQAIQILKGMRFPLQLQECYWLKGHFLEKMGNLAEAEANYQESIKIFESLREGAAGGEEEKLGFEEVKAHVYQKLIDLLLRQGKVTEAMTYLERSRLKKFRDQFDRLKPTLNNTEEEKAREKEEKLREEINEVQLLLHQEQSKPVEQQDLARIQELEKRLNLGEQDYIEYVNDLREKFPELATLLAIQPDSLIDLQALLPPQVAIVQYLILSDKLYIFVISGKAPYYKEVKVTQQDLEGKIDYMRSLLMNPQIPMNMGPMDINTFKPQDQTRAGLFEAFIHPFFKVSEELHEILLKPVEAEIAPFKVLGIIPNGKLHLLPFQALGKKASDGRFRFLIEEKSLFQLNSQSILKFAQKRASEIGAKGRLIAFGNPDNSLKYAEEEVRMIEGLFPKATFYLRQDASKDRIKTGLDGYDILHLATHGKMKGDIKESYVLMASSRDGKDNGRLYLREIWGLPLRGYQLVTLSACETAVGKEASGDIMVSLETAFLRAGTATIVASLWAVDDQATGILMKTFYENLRTRGKADALRAAQLALRSDPRFAFPYYWSPFILVGDWR